MANDNPDARKARAQAIHSQIDALKKAKDSGKTADVAPVPETPASFVHRRMQELDLKARKRKKN